jgi:hypothetical protein
MGIRILMKFPRNNRCHKKTGTKLLTSKVCVEKDEFAKVMAKGEIEG